MSQVLFVLGIILVLVALVYVLVLMYYNFKLVTTTNEATKVQNDYFQSLIEKNKAQAKRISDEKELGWEGFRKFQVAKLVVEAQDTTSVYLKPHNKKPLPPFLPGQYLTFNFNIPGQKKPVFRCYSLSDCPKDEYYRISVKKCLPPRDKPEAPSGLSSTFVNEVLAEGDIIDVKAPDGGFFLEPHESTPVCLLGGGIGVTPVLSMLKTLAKDNIQRDVFFFYGVRNNVDEGFREEVSKVRNSYANANVNVCYSNPTDENKEGVDYQYNERVSVDLLKRALPTLDMDYYLCGPPPFMNSLVNDLKEAGVPEKQIHFESFGPAYVKKKEPKKEGEASEKFNIKFAASGEEKEWDGSHDSLLEFGEDNDIAMSSGCRIGKCGTCVTAIKSGSIEYTSKPDFEVEDGSCLTCISVPKENLELDI